MKEEGWYHDPFGVHGERWISDGRPTNLVRDNGVVSHDDPPAGVEPGPMVEASQLPPRPGDMLRADGGSGVDSDEIVDAVLDSGIIGPEILPPS
jgi:hypothetical protein